MEETVAAVEEAFAAHGRKETIMPAKVYLPLEKYAGDFRAMPVYFEGTAGIKWVNAHPKNPSKHALPAVMAVLIYSDPETGCPLAIMDATHITAFRTGAAGAVAAKHLARKGAESVGLVGCGVQAGALLSALRAFFSLKRLTLFDRSGEATERFQKAHGGEAASLAEVAACDIVCTTTPSREPVLRREMIRPGTHINAMGADAPGKQELDPKILKEGRVFLDDMTQASESGEVNVPLHKDEIQASDIAGTLGEVVAGIKAGREFDEQITVFDSTGLAVQDLAVARRVYDAARKKGIGQQVDLIGG